MTINIRMTAMAAGMLVVPQSSMSASPWNEPGSTGDPWAVGYAVQVARSCPGWEVEPQETLARRGVLVRPEAGTGLMPLDGPFQREYYRGQADAEADGGRKDFCRRVREVAGDRWPRLARVLRTNDAKSSTVPQRRHGNQRS